MNAIERLHEAADESCDYSCGCDSHGNPAKCIHGDRYDALAAVDALYQAAKAMERDGYWLQANRAALAAAVRRVEGE